MNLNMWKFREYLRLKQLLHGGQGPTLLSPLLLAVRRGNADVVKVLVTNKADLDARDAVSLTD